MAMNKHSQLARRRRARQRRQTGVEVGVGKWEFSFNLIPFLNEVVSIAAGVIIGGIVERRWRGVTDGS